MYSPHVDHSNNSIKDQAPFLEFIHALNEAVQLEDLLAVVKQRIAVILDVRLYSLFLYHPEERALELLSSNHAPEGIRLPVSHPSCTLMDEVIVNQRPVVIDDFSQSSFAAASGNKPLAKYFAPASVSVPLFFHNQLVGVLNAIDKQDTCGTFTVEDVCRITLIGEHLASVLQNYRTLGRYRDTVQKLQSSLEELQETQERLVRTEKRSAISFLVAGLAHEIRNPLNSISLLLENIFDQSCAPEKICGRYLNGIKDEIGRLKSLLDEFLEFARIPALEPFSVNAEVVLKRVLSVLKPEMKNHGIDLQEEYDRKLSPVPGGEESLHRVFLNVLLNGIQAMPDGGKLSVRTGREGERVVVVIKDTGKGISPEHLLRIYDPFFTTRAKATGLGLSLVSRWLDSVGGEIQITSEVGEGTQARIILPVIKKEP